MSTVLGLALIWLYFPYSPTAFEVIGIVALLVVCIVYDLFALFRDM